MAANGISQDAISHDMSNAFGSITFAVMDRILVFLTDAQDWHLLQQRYKQANTKIPCSATFLKIGSGALPGDKIAADLFRIIFQSAVTSWYDVSDQSMLASTCPITNLKANIGKSVYADDLISRQVYACCPTKEQLENKHKHVNQVLADIITPLGLKQNRSKQDVIVTMRGKGAHGLYRELKSVNTIKDSHQVLGSAECC